MKVSVILSTYNRPQALKIVLNALARQTFKNFEVVVADDGSSLETTKLIQGMKNKLPFQLLHAWQEDKGFRAASARNNAVRLCQGDYLVFLDGDCLPRPSFIEKHVYLSEDNFFIAGNRILIDRFFTYELETGTASLNDLSFPHIWKYRSHLNRLIPLLYLPLGPLRKLNSRTWKKVRTCNLAVWRQDFLDINGFDETYEGWGFEDSDLAIRLINFGRKRKLGLFATTVFHLYHKESDRNMSTVNFNRLQSRIDNHIVSATRGING